MKKFVCPFCFTEHTMDEIEFRCQNNKCTAKERDKKFESFSGKSQIMNKVFKGNQIETANGRAKCPDCKEVSNDRVCPTCHNSLPYILGQFPNFTFAIIGAKATGKSHYVAVLINELKTRIGGLFGTNLQSIDDNTTKKYRNEFYDPLFNKHVTINETRSARADYNNRMPLIYSLSFIKRNLFGKEVVSNISTITFFDTAGEDLNSSETMRTENKYIYNSKGIILLIDPLQIPEIRAKLQGKVRLPNQNTDADDIIGRVVNLIRTSTGLMDIRKRISIPLAVVFSKIDALENILGADNPQLFQTGQNESYYDLNDAKDISRIMEECLREWGCEQILNSVKHNFKYYSFFGISAIGSTPDSSNRITKLRHIRVEDPFLWLLYQQGLIKGRGDDNNLIKDVMNRFSTKG